MYEVRHAIENRGNLCFAHEFDTEEIKGLYLVTVPLLTNGKADWEVAFGLPESERIPVEEKFELEQIAEKLGCKLY